MRLATFFFTAASLLLSATSAKAASITYMGMTISLFNQGLTGDIYAESPTALADTYLFKYEIDTAGYTGDTSFDYVKAVSLHVSTDTDLVQLTSAPGGTAGWLPVLPGGINNSGCDNAGAGDCVQTASTSFVLDGSVYTWLFAIDIDGSLLETAGIKAKFIDADGQGNILSDSILVTNQPPDVPPPDVPIPEPTSMILLGSGLVGLASAYRRRRK